MINENFKFDPVRTDFYQRQIGPQTLDIPMGQFTGANPWNFTISSADGKSPLDVERELHAYKMSVIKKQSSKNKEIKRHLNAMKTLSSADGTVTTDTENKPSILDTVASVASEIVATKNATPSNATPSAEDKKILGLTPALFYTIAGVVALTIVVLIIKHKK